MRCGLTSLDRHHTLGNTMHLRTACRSLQSRLSLRAIAASAAAVVPPRARRSSSPAVQAERLKIQLLQQRRITERLVEPLRTTIAGVSFHQDAVMQLRRGQPLLLLRESDNPHDETDMAMAVLTLSGTHLGYIKKEHCQDILLDHTFATVRSVGPSPSGTHGASILVRTDLPAITLAPLPPAALSGPQAQQLQELCAPGSGEVVEALHFSHNACEVTGLSAEHLGEPLVAAPQWSICEHEKAVEFMGVLVVAPLVAQAMQLHRMQEGSTEAEQAKAFLRDINRFSDQDVAEYLQWVRAKEAQMSSENGTGWQVRISELEEEGPEQPQQLQQEQPQQ